MALDALQSRIWEDMGVGVQWILRDTPDPFPADSSRVLRAWGAEDIPVPASEASPVEEAPRPQGNYAAAQVQRVAPLAPQKMPQRNAIPAFDMPAPARNQTQDRNAPATSQSEEVLAKLANADWKEIANLVRECRACPMSSERTQTVCADGAPGCPIVLVGEAPGRDEDLQGKPFVGKSGQLLNNILAAVGLERGRDIAVCNVLKCRPPRNRDPRPDEVHACAPFLDRQLELLKPKVVVLMGRHAVNRLLGDGGLNAQNISRLRGKVHTVNVAGVPTPAVVTYHPSYMLRSLVEKEKGWHDFLMVRDLLDEAVKNS